MSNYERTSLAQRIIRSRSELNPRSGRAAKRALEGGCGVIGIIGTDRLPGHCIIRSCEQMQNRGNGKGGGVAAAGLFPNFTDHYALHVAYLDDNARSRVEARFVDPAFDIAHVEQQPSIDDHREVGLEVSPPTVWRYFVRVRDEVLESFAKEHGIESLQAARDEFVFRNSFRLNREFYTDCGDPRAFVLSHGKDLMILKAVGYAEQVSRFYRLEDVNAHIWIGHQRYPTRGKVWHPGGAHPFAGLHEALVHNGDFANYHAITEYLRQRNVEPQFVTDTEVSALLFDHYARVLNYPLEYVIEALAPTPEGDFERLSKRRQRIYRAIQSAHLHGSPDGPWFFIVARNEPATGDPQLIGITDVSMLRPQVFALQMGDKSYGAIASEKQAIDAFFEELSKDDPGVPAMADLYWNARGGSCTDGGAFTYTLRKSDNGVALEVRDKFGNSITDRLEHSPHTVTSPIELETPRNENNNDKTVFTQEIRTDDEVKAASREQKLKWGELAGRRREQGAALFLQEIACSDEYAGLPQVALKLVKDIGLLSVLSALTYLRDRRWDLKNKRKSMVLGTIDRAVNCVLDTLPGPDRGCDDSGSLRLDISNTWSTTIPEPMYEAGSLVLDASGFEPEGERAVSRAIVEARIRGWRRFIVFRCRGDRFLGCGLGPDSADVRIDVYGSSGDYLGSGMDGAQIYVHGDAQDQVGQILKSGRIVIYGSTGQTFLYGAKGGEAFVMGNAAGRPLINAVGNIRAIINGTCLDYCAESFMAGEQTDGGFVIINGLGFVDSGDVMGLEMKYPGNNLFSLASGGACYLNDPYRTVKETQLNGASFVPFKQSDWNVILPYLKHNEQLFGISIRHDLLMVDGLLKWPKEVFRKVVASLETTGLDWSSLA